VTTLTAPLPPTESPDPTGLTLGERLSGGWQELQIHGSAACPVCGHAMVAASDHASCGGCASELR
jgi:hypothetical protein